MKQLVYTIGLVLITGVSFAQKKNVQNASIYYKDARDAMQNQKMEQAVNDYKDAKGYIDGASEHPETQNDPKMYMYKGKIYLEMGALVAMDSTNEALAGLDGQQMAEDGMAALKKSKEVDTKERYVDDVNAYCLMYRAQASAMGIIAYEKGEYEMAMGGLLGAAEFGDIAGVKDSNFYFYGGSAALQIEKWELAADAFQSCVDLGFNLGASAGYLSTALSKQGKTEEAEKVLQDAVKKAPENLDILIAMINFYIDTDRSADAEKALKAAIVLDPDNTALVYTSGNIYEQMDKIEEAKAAYNRTLELDPNHTNAKFSMGGIYFNKGADLYNEGNKLPPSDPKATQMIEESKELFKKALPYLEDAAEAEPKDVVILESLKAVYGKLGMVEEFKATKARIAELN